MKPVRWFYTIILVPNFLNLSLAKCKSERKPQLRTEIVIHPGWMNLLYITRVVIDGKLLE